MPTFTYSIIVCTKNRPKEFEAFLKNFNSKLSQSLTEVIVVDGSDPELLLVNQNLGKTLFPNQNLWKSMVTNKGKPSALNKAMEHLRSRVESDDAVVFLDDDIYFSLEGLETAIDYLLANEICGLSPLIINENEKCPKNRKEAKRIKLKRNAGRLTAFGENYWINQLDLHQEWVKTDWLPGGAVIFNWQKISHMSFSPSLENPALGGYALGDDVDFSFRANSYGNIGCLTTSQVIHSSPISAQRDYLRISQARGRWKAFLVNHFPRKVKVQNVILLELVRFFWHVMNFRKYPYAHKEFFLFLREFLRHLVK